MPLVNLARMPRRRFAPRASGAAWAVRLAVLGWALTAPAWARERLDLVLLGNGDCEGKRAQAPESRERCTGEPESNSVASGVVAFTGDSDRLGPHSTHASFAVLYLPTFDSHPPRESLLAEDWGLSSSIGWLF